MYDLSPDVARVGMPMARPDRGIPPSAATFPIAQLEEIKRRRLDMMARGKPFRLLRQMSNGRTFAMDYRPLADGGWVTLVEDVTERQRKEYELRIQFERFDQAINHMSHGLCAVDADHRIVLFNDRFLEMYGLSDDVVRVGVSMRDVIEHVGAARILPASDARAGLAAPAGEDGGRQAVPAAPEPAQRPRLHPALSPDGRRRLGHAVRGRDRAPPHGARAAPAVRALRSGDQPHVARAVHVRPGRAADRVQCAAI